MQPLLTICIPTLIERRDMFNSLKSELERQRDISSNPSQIQILSDDATWQEKSIGQKRNDLVARAAGQYIAFIDDDDEVSRNYIRLIIDAIRSNNYPDCVSLKGVITWGNDWNTAQLFEHSIKYKAYRTNESASLDMFKWVSSNTGSVKYERYPNHLSCIKTSIARQFTFPEINHGEDTSWATKIYNSGLLQTEATINECLYHYKFQPNK